MRAKEIIEHELGDCDEIISEVEFLAGPDGGDMPMGWHHKPPHPTGMWPDRPVDRTWSSMFVTHHHFAGPPFKMKLKMVKRWNLHRAEVVNELNFCVWRGSSWTDPMVAEVEGLNAVPPEQREAVKAAVNKSAWAEVKKDYGRRKVLSGLA